MTSYGYRAMKYEVFQSINSGLRKLIYSSKFFAWALFGVKARSFNSISFFELGTVATKFIAARNIQPGMRIADVGTGPYAILAIWAARRYMIDVVATDIDPSICDSAARHAQINSVPVAVRCADLLTGIDRPFDIILFAAPAIADPVFRAGVARQSITDLREIELLRLRSCGGSEGWETIDRFLMQARDCLSAKGTAFVSINRFHVSPQIIRSRIAAHDLRTLKEYELFFPFVVFAVAQAASRADSNE